MGYSRFIERFLERRSSREHNTVALKVEKFPSDVVVEATILESEGPGVCQAVETGEASFLYLQDR